MPANGKILDTIDSLYDSLTKTEKKIAKTIESSFLVCYCRRS